MRLSSVFSTTPWRMFRMPMIRATLADAGRQSSSDRGGASLLVHGGPDMGMRKLALSFVLAVLSVVLAGYASTAGSAKAVTDAPKEEVLGRYTKVAFVTSAGGEATPMSSVDRDRIVALVVRKLKERAPPALPSWRLRRSTPRP